MEEEPACGPSGLTNAMRALAQASPGVAFSVYCGVIDHCPMSAWQEMSMLSKSVRQAFLSTVDPTPCVPLIIRRHPAMLATVLQQFPRADRGRALLRVIESGDSHLLEGLVSCRASLGLDVGCMSNSPLQAAVLHNNAAMVAALLATGEVDPTDGMRAHCAFWDCPDWEGDDEYYDCRDDEHLSALLCRDGDARSSGSGSDSASHDGGAWGEEEEDDAGCVRSASEADEESDGDAPAFGYESLCGCASRDDDGTYVDCALHQAATESLPMLGMLISYVHNMNSREVGIAWAQDPCRVLLQALVTLSRSGGAYRYADCSNEAMIAILSAPFFDAAANDQFVVSLLAGSGCHEVLQWLLSRCAGVDPKANDMLPLRRAIAAWCDADTTAVRRATEECVYILAQKCDLEANRSRGPSVLRQMLFPAGVPHRYRARMSPSFPPPFVDPLSPVVRGM